MSDASLPPDSRNPNSNPNPENPYAAPQLAQAELVGDAAALGPGELPCHRCGQPVPATAGECPTCKAGPLYDGLELLVTAVAVFAVFLGSALLLDSFFKRLAEEIAVSITVGGIIVCVVVVVPPIRVVFKKLRRGRW